MQSTILVVDDNEMNRDILEMLFSDKYTVLQATNGREALETLDSCRGNIDAVLLDLVMPEMDGFELLEMRRTLDWAKNIPVIVITSSGAVEDQVHAFKLGANDYVNKPFIPEIVLSRVENVLSAHRRLVTMELEAATLKTRAELDQMTSLYNKTTAEMLSDQLLAEHPERLHALILIDIDNFKSVNDLSGHLAGDHTLRIVADLISSHFRKSDIVGRVGGDEFMVLMQDVPSVEIVRSKVNELVQTMKYKPNLTIPENVSLSIGFVINNRSLRSYPEMFRMADSALYLAKENGKARYQEYGQSVINLNDDSRPAAVLLGRNRSVCSAIQAWTPPEIRLLEALDLSELCRIPVETLRQTVPIYADATDCGGDAANFWQLLSAVPGVDIHSVIAVCPEGELDAYRAAMEAGVADILTAPVDHAAFGRRTRRHLERLGLVKTAG